MGCRTYIPSSRRAWRRGHDWNHWRRHMDRCRTAATGATVVASRLAGIWRCASHSQQLVAAPLRNNRRPDGAHPCQAFPRRARIFGHVIHLAVRTRPWQQTAACHTASTTWPGRLINTVTGWQTDRGSLSPVRKRQKSGWQLPARRQSGQRGIDKQRACAVSRRPYVGTHCKRCKGEDADKRGR